MKVLLEIEESKAAPILALLKDLDYIKLTFPSTIDNEERKQNKAALIKEIEEAVNEMKAIKRGEQEGRTLESLLNEL